MALSALYNDLHILAAADRAAALFIESVLPLHIEHISKCFFHNDMP